MNSKTRKAGYVKVYVNGMSEDFIRQCYPESLPEIKKDPDGRYILVPVGIEDVWE